MNANTPDAIAALREVWLHSHHVPRLLDSNNPSLPELALAFSRVLIWLGAVLENSEVRRKLEELGAGSVAALGQEIHRQVARLETKPGGNGGTGMDNAKLDVIARKVDDVLIAVRRISLPPRPEDVHTTDETNRIMDLVIRGYPYDLIAKTVGVTVTALRQRVSYLKTRTGCFGKEEFFAWLRLRGFGQGECEIPEPPPSLTSSCIRPAPEGLARRISKLGGRNQALIRALVEGLDNVAVATRLGISSRKARCLTWLLREKLGAANPDELKAWLKSALESSTPLPVTHSGSRKPTAPASSTDAPSPATQAPDSDCGIGGSGSPN